MKNDKLTPDGPEDRLEQDAVTGDVGGFFTWAKLEGSKYRDYSASRDKSRADARERSEMERSRGEEPVPAPATTGEAGKMAQPRRTPPVAPGTRQRKIATMPGLRTASAQRMQRQSRHGEFPRWNALNGTFRPEEGPYENEKQRQAWPTLAFFSLAGGVGKTSLAAAIGCLLAAEGVSSLLVDTHLYGLLPLFFGARELSPGTSRTFAGADSASLRILTLDNLDTSHEAGHSPAEQIAHHANGMDRILIDVSTACTDLLREILPLDPTVLVVLAPDMASVVSLQTVQGIIEQLEEETGSKIEILFLLNQFEASLRLHRDVRERLTRQLGRRLLPFAVRRSHAVAEALAEGMTLVDYAPDSQTTEDLREVARWVRTSDETAADEIQDARWRQS